VHLGEGISARRVESCYEVRGEREGGRLGAKDPAGSALLGCLCLSQRHAMLVNDDDYGVLGHQAICAVQGTQGMLPLMCHAVPCCAMLCCAVLCCAVLCCAVLCCVATCS
jgi:hypothetical protein